jgi:hypothetical protein
MLCSRVFFLLLFAASFLKANAQDSLFNKNDVPTSCKILQITPTEIRYKRFDNLNGPEYVVKREDFSYVIFENRAYENLEIETVTEKPTSTPQALSEEVEYVKGNSSYQSMFQKGYLDAGRFYKARTSTGTFVTLSTLILTPVYGLVPVTIVALSKPDLMHYKISNPQDFKSFEYELGFTEQATKIKRKRVWRNYGIVTGVYTVLYLILLASII